MDRKSKILIGIMVVLIMLSVATTFYKTVILQDFEVTGVWIEFPTETSTYVWFIYDNNEYELELDATEFDLVIDKVAEEIGIPKHNLNKDFLEYFQSSYEEAVLLTE